MEATTSDLTPIVKWKTIRVPETIVLRLIGQGFRPTDTDIAEDVDRLVKSIIGSSTDASNVNLHFEEMYGEMMLKLAQLLDRKDLVFENRQKFFGFLKVALTRHRNTLIQKHAFTLKRTGIRAPREDGLSTHVDIHEEKDHNPHDDDPHKPVRLMLDDDEHGVANYVGVDSGRYSAETMEDFNKYVSDTLAPVEAIVLRQELEPNDAAYVYAYVEHGSSGKDGKFKIRDLHKAQGVGMELTAYRKVLARVRAKMEPLFQKKTKTMTDQSNVRQTRLAELQLCEIFNLQVPSHVDPEIKRRCFTLAARDNYDKVTPDVAELLEQVGAYIPKKHGDTMSCFGVLWESKHRGCKLCALEDSCRAKAAQVGLAKEGFQVDKKLLGTRASKVPMILPKIEPPPDGSTPKVANFMVITPTDRDEEIMAFLNETMVPVLHEGEIFYRLPDLVMRRIFGVGQPERPMKLRFCNPSEAMKTKLVSIGKGPQWCVPDDMTLAEVKKLMNAHIADQLQ